MGLFLTSNGILLYKDAPLTLMLPLQPSSRQKGTAIWFSSVARVCHSVSNLCSVNIAFTPFEDMLCTPRYTRLFVWAARLVANSGKPVLSWRDLELVCGSLLVQMRRHLFCRTCNFCALDFYMPPYIVSP